MALYSPGRRRAILLLILTSVVLLTLDLQGSTIINAARSAWGQVMRPFESAAEVVSRPVRNAWLGITDYQRLEDDNDRLRRDNEAMEAEVVIARAVINENASLRAALGIETAGDYPIVSATVIGPSPSNVDQLIEINKGRNDGLENGMPVLTSNGFVIGRVTRASSNQAYVLLVADPDYSLGVKVLRPEDELPTPQFVTTTSTTTTTTTTVPTDDSGVPIATSSTSTSTTSTSSTSTSTTLPGEFPEGEEPPVDSEPPAPTTTLAPDPQRETGVLEGQGAGALLRVRLIEDTPGFGQPEVGDVVLTAGGQEGLAPADLPVGIVERVERVSPSRGLYLYVRPFASVSNLDVVQIMLYQPPSEAG